jgi:hypothetical protein
MPDISMCSNGKCTKRKTCYRFMAMPDKYLQSYCMFLQGTNGCCAYYMKVKECDKKKK